LLMVLVGYSVQLFYIKVAHWRIA